MSLKYFTNVFKGNACDSIAVNPKFVVSVFETKNTFTDESNELKQVTNIFMGSATLQVEEDMLTVVARLNERD